VSPKYDAEPAQVSEQEYDCQSGVTLQRFCISDTVDDAAEISKICSKFTHGLCFEMEVMICQ